ncbi:MAG: Flp pilus assembly complex ATPase component TadA [Lachnospiraceae bacterium]|nr:Flp pilus assembly complex ATPase component TadA [Lachnospiraceae bacterium]
MKKIRLGELLVDAGYLTNAQLEQALAIQRSSEKKQMLGELLIELGYVQEEEILQELSRQLRVPVLDMSQINPTAEVVALIPRETAVKLSLVPLYIEEDSLYVATDNPLNYYGFQDLEEQIGKQIVPYLAKHEHINIAIEQAYANKNLFNVVNEANQMFGRDYVERDTSESYQQMMDRIDSSPVVKLVNSILTQAVTMQASDIHIEPKQNNVLVRMRIDGDLVQVMVLNAAIHMPLVTRLKIISSLDIAEKRVPQDGRFSLEMGTKEVSFRISTLPSVYGEKIVIRVLGDNKVDLIPLPLLGMKEADYNKFTRLIHNPNGVILVTGPTGSGKTTTIYSALDEVAKPNVNVVTVEDPVEKNMDNLTQVHINVKAGLTFASGLRSIMRQDPDVIMVGEIRDKETALIAAQAAITGHLVLSTIHTNDAASTFMRLIDMGAEPYVVASSVIGVVAQRLVKLICEDCKEEYTPTDDELRYWDGKMMPKFYRGKGCSKCNHTGYKGRLAVYEIIMVNGAIRSLIMERASSQKIKEEAIRSAGFTDMKHNAMQLIMEGKTTLDEMRKVINFLD